MSTEVRVDPLTGLKVIIATGARRPAGRRASTSDPHAAARPRRPTRSCPATRTARRRSCTPCARRDGGGWQVRVVPNLYPALAADASAPPPEAEPDLFAAQPATGAHEVIVNAPEPVSSLGDLAPGALADRDGRVARADARPRGRRVRAPDRQRGPRGRRVAPAHPRAALRARLRARGDRPRARALRRARRAHAWAATCSATWCRRRSAGASASSPSTTRPCWSRRTPRAARTSSCSPRAAPRARFEDDGPLGAGLLADALRRLRAPLRRHPAAQPLGAHGAARARSTSAGGSTSSPRLSPLAGLELGSGVHLCTVAPEQAAAELRDAVDARARPARVERAR